MIYAGWIAANAREKGGTWIALPLIIVESRRASNDHSHLNVSTCDGVSRPILAFHSSNRALSQPLSIDRGPIFLYDYSGLDSTLSHRLEESRLFSLPSFRETLGVVVEDGYEREPGGDNEDGAG